MKRYAFAISLILLIILCNAQQLRVDDHMPDITLKNVLNWTSDSLKLSSFKKRLVILDFWSFGCSSCLEGFRKIDSLQKQFEDDIQFVAVNNESAEATRKFKQLHSRIQFPDIPFITYDSVLEKYFPRVYVPWNVWLDSGLRVRYITDGYNATREHIADFLNDVSPAIRQLKFDSAYFTQSSLLGNANLAKSITCYSYIAHCVPEWSIGNICGYEDNRFHLSLNCASPVFLLQTAFGERGKFDFSFPSTVIVEKRGVDAIYFPPRDINKLDDWKQKFCYSYDLVVPASNANEAFKIMQRDVCNYFQVNVQIKKKKITCYALSRISNSKPIGTIPSVTAKNETDKYNFQEVKIKAAIQALNNLFLAGHYSTFVIDGIGGDRKISFALDQSLFEKTMKIDDVNSQLQQYNLKLVSREIIKDVMIIN